MLCEHSFWPREKKDFPGVRPPTTLLATKVNLLVAYLYIRILLFRCMKVYRIWKKTIANCFHGKSIFRKYFDSKHLHTITLNGKYKIQHERVSSMPFRFQFPLLVLFGRHTAASQQQMVLNFELDVSD